MFVFTPETDPSPPAHDDTRFKIFLAGSIEQGKAEDWQSKVITTLKGLTVPVSLSVYNPRNKNWDKSWGEGSVQLERQIKWELRYLRSCDITFFYFDPKTISPISLLELGMALKESKWHKPIVVCPTPYFRYTNIDITCSDNNVHVVHETLDEGIEALIRTIKQE